VYDFQAELMPAMKSFYSPLKKAIGKVQKDNNEWAGKYKKEVRGLKGLGFGWKRTVEGLGFGCRRTTTSGLASARRR
jgi:hypothetical protein